MPPGDDTREAQVGCEPAPSPARWYEKLHHVQMAALCAVIGVGFPVYVAVKGPPVVPRFPANWQLWWNALWWVMSVLGPLGAGYWAYCIGRRALWLYGLGKPHEAVLAPPNRLKAAIPFCFGLAFTIEGIFEPVFLVVGPPMFLMSIPPLFWAFERQPPRGPPAVSESQHAA